MKIYELLNKMEGAERAFLDTRFLAPVTAGARVRVRIAGVACTLRVVGRPDAGWALLEPLSLDRARVVGQPSMRQVRDYLALLPAVRLVLMMRAGEVWLAMPAHRGDRRIAIDGTVRVHLVTGGEAFQSIVARFDGQTFWFEEVDRRRNPALGAHLRAALASGTPPDEVQKQGLTPEEREAYGLVSTAVEEARRDPVEGRLDAALAHAGAQLASYVERDDGYGVTFAVDGHTHRAVIRNDDLTVMSAGICLSGHDQRFDLQSLVSVLREGHETGRLWWMGGPPVRR